ncbi:MAG: hypothetical protein PF961_05375 [Planctomycetota bacterium]|nr:hypothetical protein [Planctomycetota bacterium]
MLQARVLLIVGLGWIAVGLYLGFDPLAVAWRAALGALIATVATGALLRMALRTVAAAVLAQAPAETHELEPATPQ